MTYMKNRITGFAILSTLLLAGCSLEVNMSEEFMITDEDKKAEELSNSELTDETKETDFIDTTHKTVDAIVKQLNQLKEESSKTKENITTIDLEAFSTPYYEKESLLTEKQRFKYSSTMLAMNNALEDVETINSLNQKSFATKSTKKYEEMLMLLNQTIFNLNTVIQKLENERY